LHLEEEKDRESNKKVRKAWRGRKKKKYVYIEKTRNEHKRNRE
jgi:hypothetical protein